LDFSSSNFTVQIMYWAPLEMSLAYVKLEILCHIRGFFFSISNFYAMTSRSLSYHIQCLGQVIHVYGSHEWHWWYVTVVQKFNVHVFVNLQWFN
jgi:hypothetical protein